MTTSPRAAVALSGGVDSALAAALLVDAGHRVTALTMDLGLGEEALGPARQVARALGLDHEVVDCREAFEAEVLEPAWREYAEGRTPSPCVVCNARVKVALLLRRAEGLGAAFLATGHHARRLEGAGGPRLARGRDRSKDQSYFLGRLEPAQLAALRFPVGEMTKAVVRQRAAALGLPPAARPDSQDLCLAAPGRAGAPLAELLRQRFGAEPRPGPVQGPDGAVAGRHGGLHLFTVGQRRGLGVSLGRPAWVASIDGETAEVRLVTDRACRAAPGLAARDARWLRSPAPAEGEALRCRAQIRSRHAAAEAAVEVGPGGTLFVALDEPQEAVTPGQALVLYEGDEVIGSAWIDGPRG